MNKTEQRNIFIERLRAKKLKGGALYISTIIAVLIGVLLSLSIILTRYSTNYTFMAGADTQLHYNLRSGVELARSVFFSGSDNNNWIKNTYTNDSIKVKNMHWGAYRIISIATKSKNRLLTHIGMYGVQMNQDTCLIVSDNGKPIYLSGTTTFKAKAYLPTAGIKSGNIYGNSQNVLPGNAKMWRPNSHLIPLLNNSFVAHIENQQKSLHTETDSIAEFIPEGMNRSFSSKTFVVQREEIKLSGQWLKNNIKLICKEIEINNSCELNNILIICEKIRIKEGFKGNIHVIASDSIYVEKNCELTFPSSFILMHEKSSDKRLRYIAFEKGCTFYGSIIAFNNADNHLSTDIYISFSEDTQVHGLVYSGGYAHLEGSIYGTVASNKLFIKTPGSVYENYIHNCKLAVSEKPAEVIVADCYFNKRVVCCQDIQ